MNTFVRPLARSALSALAAAVALQPTEALSEIANPANPMQICFTVPDGPPVSAAVRAAAYLVRVREHTRSPYLDRICSPDIVKQAELARSLPARLRVDGEDDEWEGLPEGHADVAGNIQAHDPRRPASTDRRGIDLESVSVLLTDEHVLLRLMFHGNAAMDPDTSYWLHFDDSRGRRLLDIREQAGVASVNRYVSGKFSRTEELRPAASELAVGRVVEWRIARAALRLSIEPGATVFAAAFSAKRNLVNWSRPFAPLHVDEFAVTPAARVLVHLSDELRDGEVSILPAAVALSEGGILERVEPSLVPRVIADARAMLRYGRGVLSEVPFEAALAWSNRGFLWGSLAGLHLDERSRITSEAYDFMFLDPRILRQVAGALQPVVSGSGGLEETVMRVRAWVVERNRYRWKLDRVAEWARDDPSYQTLLEEIQRDVAAGRHVIARVNGREIYHWWVGSANLHWKEIKRSGFYYGPCGDVTVVSMLAFKALGIPDLAMFRSFGNDMASHTFPAYYSAAENSWKPPAAELPPVEWADREGRLQFALPHAGRLESPYRRLKFGLAEVWVNERSPAEAMDGATMRQRLLAGVSNRDIAEAIERAATTPGGEGGDVRNTRSFEL